ncbi:MAG TPA: long-chain fatty acid--CoA ligase [Sedimenticola thiotaurini]|uniref:Long-chain fatty acid--CoA ligase n=1 Tax=Sedimenticola thiotaurini TaxID=1543721 RepID=A0A831RL97_9GAMM|nr:long-chain fatty acid--CoA ligase [Sedimenticola thiotaurini]
MPHTDIILLEQVRSLADAFRERVRRTPEAIAYLQYHPDSGEWHEYSWADSAIEVARWQQALTAEGLRPGDRVAVMLRNCREWVTFDQAALGLGLVVVPIYTNDRPENVGYILQDAGVRLLLIGDGEQWQALQEIQDQLAGLTRIVSLEPVTPVPLGPPVRSLAEWLPGATEDAPELRSQEGGLDDLATIVYTSGTTGRSKGVMLSHRNILFNAGACLQMIDVFPRDRMLSFLPLSHMLERTLGYYLPILAGSQVAFARSIPELAEDLQRMRPTILISVPRIFERIYHGIHDKLARSSPVARRLFDATVATGWRRFERSQGRKGWSPALLGWPLLQRLVARKVQQRLGGRLRFAVSGGAALAPEIARMFIGLGIRIQQGYGLTETSPVISANPLDDNLPASVGVAIPGVEVKIGDQDELLTRSPSVMLGYWDNPEATREAIDADGWLHTGDQARIGDGHIYLTGRLKEIIVLANGEKVPPADMEMAIAGDDLVDQVLVVGEGRPFLAALVVPEREALEELLRQLGHTGESAGALEDEGLKGIFLERIQRRLHAFPGYARIRELALIPEPWGIGEGLMTPTLKLRRSRILERHAERIEALYRGH